MNRKYWRYSIIFSLVICLVASNLLVFSSTAVVAANVPVFTNVTDGAGLYYRNETWASAWGDYDQDGWLDLFLGNHPSLSEVGSELKEAFFLRNNHDGTFSNVIHASGIGLLEDRHDIVFVDYDEDDDLDIWMSISGRGGQGEAAKQLWQNNGSGFFQDVAAQAGVDYPKARGRGSVWLDYDLDNDLDMFFTTAERLDAPNTFFRNNGDGTFTDITAQLGIDPFLGAQSNVAAGDYDSDGDPDIFVAANSCRLYRNDGDHFTNVTGSAGVTTGSGASAAWGDYDNDGDLDLFVARGAQDLEGDYKEVTGNVVRYAARADAGDVDGLDFVTASNDIVTFDLQERTGSRVDHSTAVVFLGPDGHHPPGNPFSLDSSAVSTAPSYTPGSSDGIYVWQSEPGYWHIRWTAPVIEPRHSFGGIITATISLQAVTEINFETPKSYSLPNRLYKNQGNGTFVDVARAAGVADAQDSRSADWGDFDNDGNIDLFVQTAGHYGNNAPDLLYRNNGNGTFTNVADQAAISGTLDGYGWGGIWADYDNDGFLDLLTSHESWHWPLDKGRYELFHNEGNTNHWLEIELHGDVSNNQGYGSRVWITAGGKTLLRELNDNSHYFQHYSGPLHVGLGDSTEVNELRIVWQSGYVQVFNSIPVDQRIQVIEGQPLVTLTPTTMPTGTPTSTDTDTPTPTETETPSPTELPTPTATSGQPATDTPTPTPTATDTFTATATQILSPTDTNTPPPEILIDNLHPQFSVIGTWLTGSGSTLLPFGSDFVYKKAGSGENKAIFRPQIPAWGDYEVYIWYPKCWVCAINAPFTINHVNGSTTILVNLNDRNHAGMWMSMGVFTFDAGTTGIIMVTDEGNARVTADAVRLVPRSQP